MRVPVRSLMSLSAALLFAVSAFAQTAERYIVFDVNTAQAHVFNVSDNAEVAVIKTGASPNSAVISGNGRLAFVGNLNSEHVSVIDLTIQAEVKRIRPVRIGQLAMTPDGTTVLGADIDDQTLKLIDTTTFAVTRTISLNGQFGDNPSAADVNIGTPVVIGSRVYLNTNFALGFVDLATGSITTTDAPNLGRNVLNQNLTGSVDGKFVAAIRRNGLVIVDPATNTILRTIGGIFIAVESSRNPATPNIAYAVRFGAAGAAFSIVDLNAGTILSDVPIPGPFAEFRTQLGLTADSSRAYVSAATSNPNTLVIDTNLALTNPAAAITSQFTIGTQTKIGTVGFTQNQPPVTAPVVSSVTPGLVVNAAASSIQISGSGFASDAQVRVGSLDPIPAQFISSSQLVVPLPAGSAAQGAAIVVTNPDTAQGPGLVAQSGILRNAFIIASQPAFQPVNQAAVVNFADSTLSVLNVSTNATVATPVPTGPRPIGLAITPDGSRAFIPGLFSPSSVDVYNFITNSVEARVQLNGALSGLPGQTKAVVIAPRFGTGNLVAYVAASLPAPTGFTLNLYAIGADPAAPGFESVVATFPTGAPSPSGNPGSLAVTPDGHFAFIQAFVLNSPVINFAILDLNTGVSTIVPGATLGIHGFQPTLEVSPDGKFLVAEADDGHLLVFDVASNPAAPSLAATVGTPLPGGFLLPRIVGSVLYAFDPANNQVQILNFNPAGGDFSGLGSFIIPGTISVFGNLCDVTPDAKLIYCPLREDDAVAVVDTVKVVANDPAALVTKIGTGIAPGMVAIRPGTPTASGTNVSVQPIPEISLNFSSVTTAGTTSATTTNTNPDPLPAGFALGAPPIYYEISTTAVPGGPIQVCIHYNPAQFTGPEGNIRLLHDEGGTFVDVTTSLDVVNHVVCGQVTHFSAFTVGTASVDFFFDSLLAEINAGVADRGLREDLTNKIQEAERSFDRQRRDKAIDKIKDFEDKVRDQTGRKLSTAEAARLLQMAEVIVTRL